MLLYTACIHINICIVLRIIREGKLLEIPVNQNYRCNSAFNSLKNKEKKCDGGAGEDKRANTGRCRAAYNIRRSMMVPINWARKRLCFLAADFMDVHNTHPSPFVSSVTVEASNGFSMADQSLRSQPRGGNLHPESFWTACQSGWDGSARDQRLSSGSSRVD